MLRCVADAIIISAVESSPRNSAAGEPRVLIVRAGAIGDTLMVTPVLRAVRRSLPGAHITFVASESAAPVLRCNPHLDELLTLSHRHVPAWLSWQHWRITRRLRSSRLAWALVLESHPDFIALARRARPLRLLTYGAAAPGDGIQQVPFHPQRHSVENHLRAAEVLGVKPAGTHMELAYPAEMDDLVRRRLALAGIGHQDRLVGVHAGWGGRAHSLTETRLKSWPPERFAEVVRELVRSKGVAVVLTGSRQDRPLTQFIAERAGVACLNWAGELPLLGLAALIRRLRAYLTVDSGPAHMAAALGTPLVTLWGPAIRAQTAPLPGTGPVRLLDHHVACAPCYDTPLMKACRNNLCMKAIEAHEVLYAIEAMLA